MSLQEGESATFIGSSDQVFALTAKDQLDFDFSSGHLFEHAKRFNDNNSMY